MIPGENGPGFQGSVPSVIVVGAGMGGLSAALGLARRSCTVRVVEAARELREVGAGVTLGPNATRVLADLGVLPSLVRVSSLPSLQVVQSWEGEVLLSAAPNASDQASTGYLQVHRADLQQCLADALEKLAPGAIALGKRVMDCEADGHRPAVILADGSRLEADIIVGADGIHSTIRSALFPIDEPRFTQFVAYRGLVPREHMPNLASEAPSGLTIGAGKSFLRYMIRGGDILNFVAFVNTPSWEREGWSLPCPRSEVEEHFVGVHDDVRRILAATPGARLHKWGLFSRQPLQQWTCGGVALLGDAAHPMLPFLGQGASMAMEDGCIIARAIAGASSPEAALRAYETARVSRGNAVAAASAERAAAIHSGDPAAYGKQVRKPGVASREQLFDYNAPETALSFE